MVPVGRKRWKAREPEKEGTAKVGQSFRIKINPNLARVVKSRENADPSGLRMGNDSGRWEEKWKERSK